MRKYLVLYEKRWMKGELVSDRKLFIRLDGHCKFEYQVADFTDAPMTENEDGSKVSETWLRNNVITDYIIENFDGIVLVMNGERLNGRNGVHTKKLYGAKRFSIIQMEAKQGWYRTWKLSKTTKHWELGYTRKRSKENYKQIIYTFEHEIGHSLCWLKGIRDSLHLFVSGKRYEEWWEMMHSLLR